MGLSFRFQNAKNVLKQIQFSETLTKTKKSPVRWNTEIFQQNKRQGMTFDDFQDACGDALILASSPQERQELLQAAANALRCLDGENVCGSLGEQWISFVLNNHGSGKWLYANSNYCWRDPFLTSMIMGGGVPFCVWRAVHLCKVGT